MLRAPGPAAWPARRPPPPRPGPGNPRRAPPPRTARRNARLFGGRGRGQLAPRYRRTPPRGRRGGAPRVGGREGGPRGRGLPSREAAGGVSLSVLPSSRAGPPPRRPSSERKRGDAAPRVSSAATLRRVWGAGGGELGAEAGGWGSEGTPGIPPCPRRASGNFPPGAAAAPRQARRPRAHAHSRRRCPPPGGALRGAAVRDAVRGAGAGCGARCGAAVGLRGRCPPAAAGTRRGGPRSVRGGAEVGGAAGVPAGGGGAVAALVVAAEVSGAG